MGKQDFGLYLQSRLATSILVYWRQRGLFSMFLGLNRENVIADYEQSLGARICDTAMSWCDSRELVS